MLVAVWREKILIQFSLKNKALNFRGVFLAQLVELITKHVKLTVRRIVEKI